MDKQLIVSLHFIPRMCVMNSILFFQAQALMNMNRIIIVLAQLVEPALLLLLASVLCDVIVANYDYIIP